MTTQTILQYNGVRLQNVQTLNFVETPINSDSGQYVYTRTELKVLGYFTLDAHKNLGAQPHVSSAATSSIGASQHFALLKLYLEQPRRRLVYSTMTSGSPDANDTNLGTPHFIIEPAKEELVDADNDVVNMLVKNDVKAGPIPGPVSVTHVANNQVWRVEFTVTFHTVPPCISAASGHIPTVYGESLNPKDDLDSQITIAAIPVGFSSVQRQLGVLANRWSCQDRIDENGYTTRTYTGNVTLANPNWNPNDFRAITIPPIVPGMQRQSIEYVASEDNLSLRYTVTDHEVTVTAPHPARTMKIVHNEAITNYGAKGNFSLRIALTGDRHCSLYDLFLLAYAIAEQRLMISAAVVVNEKTSIILHRTEFTSEQGTDQSHAMTLVMSGDRFSMDNPQGQVGLHLNSMVSRAVTWRPVIQQGGGPLDGYNNVLSKGNRIGEQPDTEGSIPAISCLHAKLTSPCSPQYTMEASTPDREEITKKIRRSDNLRLSTDLYNTTDLYAAYPTTIDIAINDNLADAPTNTKYSAAHQTNMYSHYNISSTYGEAGLNVALPLAYTNSSRNLTNNVVVEIGPRQYTRRIRIEAERVGEPPRLPQPVAIFTEASSSYPDVVNTLKNATVTHLNPAPVADGKSLIYTSHLEMEYSQSKAPAMHRYGIPDYIAPTTSGSLPITDKELYRNELMDIFPSETSLTGW